MDSSPNTDSPLSTSFNVIAILTFIVALVAALYVRVTYLRNSSSEYFRVKTSLAWYKTESQWLDQLVSAGTVDGRRISVEGGGERAAEYAMYAFVMEDLLNLEKRLLAIVEQVEELASRGSTDEDIEETSSDSSKSHTLTHTKQMNKRKQKHWTFIRDEADVHTLSRLSIFLQATWWIAQTWLGLRTSLSVAWLSVRTEALELVRQREGLTTRVQFLQMNMLAGRMRELEATMRLQGKGREMGNVVEDVRGEDRGKGAA